MFARVKKFLVFSFKNDSREHQKVYRLQFIASIFLVFSFPLIVLNREHQKAYRLRLIASK